MVSQSLVQISVQLWPPCDAILGFSIMPGKVLETARGGSTKNLNAGFSCFLLSSFILQAVKDTVIFWDKHSGCSSKGQITKGVWDKAVELLTHVKRHYDGRKSSIWILQITVVSRVCSLDSSLRSTCPSFPSSYTYYSRHALIFLSVCEYLQKL